MKIKLANIVEQSFRVFSEKYGFRRQNEVDDGQVYSVEYASISFIIKLEKYRYEIYATLRKADKANDEIELFNLLSYLAQPSLGAPKSKYFRYVLNYEKRYRKQLAHIVASIERYSTEIIMFFNSEDYAAKVADVRKFIINKNPKLFKQEQPKEEQPKGEQPKGAG
jgi:hypothetical protein